MVIQVKTIDEGKLLAEQNQFLPNYKRKEIPC